MLNALNGWIVLDKPLGLSSAQALGRVKRILREAGIGRSKIGHGGTLDPLATGVLPIAMGEATKMLAFLLDADKAYDFTVRWGEERTTDDAEGEVTATSPVRPDAARIEAVLDRFRGPITQTPPPFSALKVDGERAYDIARKGGTVVLQPRAVILHRLDLLGCPDPDHARFAVACSKGTYVRALARDLGRALGSAAHVTALRRTQAGPFTIDQAISLDTLAECVHSAPQERWHHPMTAGLDDIPALAVDPNQARLLRHGQRISLDAGARPEHDGIFMATLDAVPVAMVELKAGRLRVMRGLNME